MDHPALSVLPPGLPLGVPAIMPAGAPSRQTRPWLHRKTLSLSLGWLLLRVVTALRLHHRSMQLHTIAVIVLANDRVVELPGSSGNHAEGQHLFAVSHIRNSLSGNRASLRRDCSRLVAWQLAIMRKTSDASQNLLAVVARRNSPCVQRRLQQRVANPQQLGLA